VEFLGEFRRKSEECLRWARNSRSAKESAAWLNMAQLWLGLAQKAEARGATAAPPPAADRNSKPHDPGVPPAPTDPA